MRQWGDKDKKKMENKTQMQKAERLSNEEIDRRLKDLLTHFRKLRANIWPATISRETMERFGREAKQLEAMKKLNC